MTVTQLAKRVGVTPESVRYYTRIALLKPTIKAENGYRLFSTENIKRLKFALRAKDLGFTLAEIAQILHHAQNHDSPCPLVRGLLARRIKENRERLDQTAQLQIRMDKLGPVEGHAQACPHLKKILKNISVHPGKQGLGNIRNTRTKKERQARFTPARCTPKSCGITRAIVPSAAWRLKRVPSVETKRTPNSKT